jgi:succinate-semialdehyde dehydrogenase/glutarate-semialdehyde dehydrogenase
MSPADTQLASRAGVPPGVIQVIMTNWRLIKIGKELCENELAKKMSFTGKPSAVD